MRTKRLIQSLKSKFLYRCSNFTRYPMKFLFKFALLVCVFTGTVMSIQAQEPVPPPMPAYQPLSDVQLDQLLGPIALYPDPLIAEILPASTFPTQIVLADRYVIGSGDPNQINQQPWDVSVQAMARYPSVLKWMDDNLNATTELGQAFLNQQPAVMASIQRLRASASKLGNLQSTPQQQVTDDGGDIEIDPADDQEMYVPVYQPDQVYDDSSDGSPYITFGIGYPIGDWLDNDFDWGNDDLIYWNQGYSRPANWWHESRGQRSTGNTSVWRSGNHRGGGGASRGDRGYAPAPATTRPDAAFTGGGSGAARSAPAAIRPDTAFIGAPPAAIRSDSPFTGGDPARQASQQDQRADSVNRTAAASTEHYAPVRQPEANGALIGAQSSQATRTYSDRGQQSMRAITRSAPASRPAASAGHAGGGGGGHAGGGGGSGHAGGGGGHK
jgi:hypothetical protein